MDCSQNIQVWKTVLFSRLDKIANLIIKTYFASLWMSLKSLFSVVEKTKEEVDNKYSGAYPLCPSELFRTRHYLQNSASSWWLPAESSSENCPQLRKATTIKVTPLPWTAYIQLQVDMGVPRSVLYLRWHKSKESPSSRAPCETGQSLCWSCVAVQPLLLPNSIYFTHTHKCWSWTCFQLTSVRQYPLRSLFPMEPNLRQHNWIINAFLVVQIFI